MEDIVCKKCGSVNDYNIQPRGKHQTAFCNNCEAYIKNLPQGKPTVLHFGKYAGRELVSMVSAEEIRYLQWLHIQSFVKEKLSAEIEAYLKTV